MADDKTNTGPDRKRINVGEAYEITYWSAKLGVSKETLEEAVKKVGPMAEDVARELGK